MRKMQRACAFVCAAAIVMSGCAKTAKEAKTEKNSGSKAVKSTKTENAVSQELRALGSTITVADIKAAYGVDDSSEIMPLYNVSQNEEFNFTFNFDQYESDLDLYDFVSVHTDAACGDESSIYYTASLERDENSTTITVAPMEPILKTESLSQDYVYNEIDSWGNAPIYYLAIHYDMDAETPVKLEQPTIIPFTVQNEVNAPNVKGTVDSTGRFRLEWDPVEGAEKYIIYHLTDGTLSTGEDNHAIDGAKVGYTGLTMLVQGETTELCYDNFAGEGHGLAEIESDSLINGEHPIYNAGQNYCVNGEFFVSAVVNGKESGVSAPVSTAELQLPHVLTEESDIMFKMYPTASDFPTEVDVLNIDGSVSKHAVTYTRQIADVYGYQMVHYEYVVEGTAITGYVSPEDEILDNSEIMFGTPSSSSNGTAKPEDNVDMIPDTDVDTIIPAEPDKEIDTDNIIDAQKENTQQHIEKANREQVENAPEGVYINADSAEEEWLALNFVQGNTEISVEAFPSLQDPYTLVDTFNKVYYQNPYILGVTAYTYDYNTLTFCVSYSYDNDTIRSKQADIASKADSIIKEIITDDMSDSDKTLAIYNYLVNNSSYDEDALKAAEESGFSKDGLADFEDSFNTYGIMVNGKGVCQSYAYSFKLLCDLCDTDAVVVTGFLNGDLPHAWNMVKLDDEWYEVDCTNNAVTTGIPYFLFNADTELAVKSGYTKDTAFELDDAVAEYNGADAEKEYYTSKGLTADTLDAYKQLITENVTDETSVFAVRWNGSELSNEELSNTVALAFNELGLESKLENVGFAESHGFVVIVIR